MSTVLWRSQGEQFFDNAGAMLAGGKLWFYEAGTTDLQTTYFDQSGDPGTENTNPVTLNGYGRLDTPIYFVDGPDYKELLTTSTAVTVAPWPFDNIPAAPPEAATESFAAPLLIWTQVTSASSPVALTVADLGRAYECDTTAGDIEFDFPAASACTNKGFIFKKTAAANSVILDPSGSETIDDASTSMTITAKDSVFSVFSNGAELYLVDGAFTGDNLARGLASLTEETTAFDRAADLIPFYDASATYPKTIKGSNLILPGTHLVTIEDQKAQNTGGGTFTSGANRTRDLGTLAFNLNTIASLASNQFTLPAGKFRIAWVAPAYEVGSHQSFLYNVTDAAEVARGTSAASGSSDSVHSTSNGSAVVTLAASKAFEIRHRSEATKSTTGFGQPANFGTEIYTRVEIYAA